MLIQLFKTMFGSSKDYNNINFNYYTNFIKELSKADAEIILNLKAGQNFRKVLKIWWKPISYNIWLPKSQQNNGHISLYIKITYNNEEKKDFHGIFKKECGKLVNYGIREYKVTEKMDNWFVIFEKSEKEICFNWHGYSKK